MGYVSPIDAIDNYQLGTDLLISNDTETSTQSSSYVLAKTITVALKIYKYMNFMAEFKIKGSLGGAANFYQAYITHNGTMVGAVQETGQVAYQTMQQDITGEEWYIDDTISLYMRNNSGGANDCYVKEFRLYGIETPFYNTKESI